SNGAIAESYFFGGLPAPAAASFFGSSFFGAALADAVVTAPLKVAGSPFKVACAAAISALSFLSVTLFDAAGSNELATMSANVDSTLLAAVVNVLCTLSASAFGAVSDSSSAPRNPVNA